MESDLSKSQTVVGLEINVPLKSNDKIFPAGLGPCFDTFPSMQHWIGQIDKFVQSRDNFGGQRWIVLNHLDRPKHEGIPEIGKLDQNP